MCKLNSDDIRYMGPLLFAVILIVAALVSPYLVWTPENSSKEQQIIYYQFFGYSL